jgi:hypothetical protein
VVVTLEYIVNDVCMLLQDSLLRTLDEVHAQQELSVMELSHGVEKAKEKMEDACRFTERLIQCGSDIDVVTMRKMCSLQLWTLTRDTPKVDADFGLQFVTQEQAFDKAVDRFFGSIVSKIYEKQVSGLIIRIVTVYCNENFVVIIICLFGNCQQGSEMSSLSPADTDGLVTSSLELSTPLDGATSALSSLTVSPLSGVNKRITAFSSSADTSDCSSLPLSLASRIVGSSTAITGSGNISKVVFGNPTSGHPSQMFKQMPVFPAPSHIAVSGCKYNAAAFFSLTLLAHAELESLFQ